MTMQHVVSGSAAVTEVEVDAELDAALEERRARDRAKRDRLVAFLARPGVERVAIDDAPERSWP